MLRIIRAFLRRLAKNTLHPGLRMALFRLSGITIGSESFINMDVLFVDNYRKNAIKLGNRVAVAPGTIFVADSDPNNSRLKSIKFFTVRGTITVRDDAWIGANAVILPNINIGKQAVVGAGAVVTRDVENFAIVGGIPARKIGDVRMKQGHVDYK
ncbi:MAG: acyltransferase [Deltaproteobacteria bacterium]|nr:acyltransferase [Deltaproteobacteria bacterium]